MGAAALESDKPNKTSDYGETENGQPPKDESGNSKKKLPEFPNGVIKFNNPDLLKGLTGNPRPAAGNKRQGYSNIQAEFRSGVTTSLVGEAKTLAMKYLQIVEEELGYSAMQV